MNTIKRFGIAVGFLLIVVIPIALAQNGNSLEGRVLLPNGSPPPHPVKVTLTYSGVRIYETFTDLSGRFSFSGLRRGVYQLEAEGDSQSFETTRVSAEVTQFGSAPLSYTQNIPLKMIPGKTLPKAETVSLEELDSSIPQKARDDFRKGMKRAEDNRPEDAIKLFKQAIEQAPAFYLAHLSMADQFLKTRRYEEAATEYQKAAELKPDKAEPLNGLGSALIGLRRYGEGLPHLKKVVDLGKATAGTYMYLGLAETMTGEYDAAEADLLRAYSMNKSSLAHIYLANLYELKGEPAKAIEQLQAFLKENPESPQSEQIRGAIEKLKRQTVKKK
ncbi:MAG TPA: tetratricopeptide repeat protein [Blastocatellia bacterium]|nr:tetratricopeptide repeat protein [Blastocatellia bacterium]